MSSPAPGAVAPFQAMSLAAVARAARRHAGDGQTVLRLCLQFIDDYRETPFERRARLLARRPPSTGDPRWDAFLAALAEHFAYHDGLPVPAWAGAEDRFLRQSWFPTDLPSVRTAAVAESPAAFRCRGVFICEDLFARA